MNKKEYKVNNIITVRKAAAAGAFFENAVIYAAIPFVSPKCSCAAYVWDASGRKDDIIMCNQNQQNQQNQQNRQNNQNNQNRQQQNQQNRQSKNRQDDQNRRQQNDIF